MGKEIVDKIIIAFLVIVPLISRADSGSSVLSKGEWYKIAIPQDGIYKINHDFLINMGLNPDEINPQNLQIYGNGGHLLPQSNSILRANDIVENAIYFSGENNTRFGNDDYFLFYGQGPDKLAFIEGENGYLVDYQHHYYSDSSYYFITVGENPGKRIGISDDIGHNFPSISSYDDLQYHEINERKLSDVPSGREWYGEVFRNTTRLTLEFDVSGLAQNSNIQLITNLMASSKEISSFNVGVNDLQVSEIIMESIPDATYSVKGKERKDIINFNSSTIPINTENLLISFEYISAGSVSTGYLNYLNLWVERNLSTNFYQLKYRSLKSVLNSSSTFIIKDSSNPISIWDVTDPLHPKDQLFSMEGDNYIYGTETIGLKEFILFNKSDVNLPVFSGRIDNQNLHGVMAPEFLIITHPDFISAANQLASHREAGGISTLVVTVEQIYNEFSSGAQDITAIRDFIKYLYDQNKSNPALKYVLLFGKGSYDYKNIGPSPYYNFVPIYESLNSLHPIYSYSSDDYYGFMDDDEGEWIESFPGDHDMDLAIGRIPVINKDEAMDIINKIKIYETNPESFGPWRNNISFVADDGDGVDGIRHSFDADRLTDLVDTTYTNFNIEKIYIDAYPQIIQPNNSQSAPEVNEAINNAIKNGVLIMNYTGHGNEQQWAHEAVLTNTMINGWSNVYKLPFFVTATCEFGRHDDKMRSGAEVALINKRGGAIGLVTTARPVFASSNYVLNKSFYNQVFEKINGKYQTIGEIFTKTKNNSLNGPVNRNFSLLGDPSMKLAYPDKQIILEKINEIPVNSESDTLKALKKMRVQGKIYDADFNHITQFNGKISTRVFDKKGLFQTLGTQDPVMYYNDRKSLIFNGESSVNNGTFIFEFVVPKNISYEIGDGKISLYAISEDKTLDAAGSNNDIQVGGSIHVDELDLISPEITLFLDDTTFQAGGVTSNHPILYARLFDENGISIIENGINPGIVAVLDDENNFVLNNFYLADLDSYQKGEVKYQFSDLSDGKHRLSLRVWDTYNNMAEASIEFLVGESNSLIIQNLLNYPNPFSKETVFSFEHNRAGDDIEFKIEIYSSRGELVKSISGVTFNSEFRINDILWDGRGGSGKKLESGLYVYRVFLRSLRDGAKNADFKKLVIIN